MVYPDHTLKYLDTLRSLELLTLAVRKSDKNLLANFMSKILGNGQEFVCNGLKLEIRQTFYILDPIGNCCQVFSFYIHSSGFKMGHFHLIYKHLVAKRD